MAALRQDAGLAKPATAPAAGRRGLVASLDAPTRRKLARLGAEVLLLTLVVAVVYGGPAIRGGAKPPSPAPTPVVRPATLGLAANEITAVFAMARNGEFEFSDEGQVDGAPLLTGRSGDGASSLELWGQPADLQRVTLSFELAVPRRLDDAQQHRLGAFLALYAPAALEPLLAELRAAFAEGREARRTLDSGRVSVRLRVSADGQAVDVILLPTRLAGPGDPPSAAPVAPPS